MIGSDDSSVAIGEFPPTQWSMILAAGAGSNEAAGAALDRLCRLYWSPLYVFARRKGHPPAEAEDLTQGFFEELIDVGLVTRANVDRGRFRWFLLGSFKNFIRDENRRNGAVKRGGNWARWSMDACAGEALLHDESASGEPPDVLFDWQWAMSLLEEVFRQLQIEYGRSGRENLFQQLRPFIQGDHAEATYAEVAQALGTTEGTVKVTVHRLRKRFRELLRFHVLQTLADPLQVEEEMRHLVAALRR